jgi:hypothetical protein
LETYCSDLGWVRALGGAALDEPKGSARLLPFYTSEMVWRARHPLDTGAGAALRRVLHLGLVAAASAARQAVQLPLGGVVSQRIGAGGSVPAVKPT